MVKFQQYDKVKIKNANGAWIILANAIEIDSDGFFTILEDKYVIHSITKSHPEPIQTKLPIELEFQV